jgi:hypothetical protein
MAAIVRPPPWGVEQRLELDRSIVEDEADVAAFRSQPDLDTYAIAGAFVEWLLAGPGKEVLPGLYGALENRAYPQENRRELERRLGKPMAQVDAEIRAWALGGGGK